ncbi:MAG: cephalosporin hydroxylase family protein [Verrucomicrobiia bacterium]
MKLTIDTDKQQLTIENGDSSRILPLYSKEAFEEISRQWLKVGWNQKYPYTFSWLGRPIIQIPEDIIRIQEVIYTVKPDVIIETGIAHGGSLVFSASLCKVMGKGRVIGIDIEIRPHNRKAIESHFLYPYITMIEGSSTDPQVLEKVKALVKPDEQALVILDSCHTKAHVLAELEAYHIFVKPGSYIIATDGSMQDLYDVPRGKPEWKLDNPAEAAREFAKRHPEFIIEQPKWLFNESELSKNITHWQDAFLKRIK